jgi:O-antigen/teichoic acid export membrane protein
VVGGLGFLQNIDIIFAKGLFDKHTAGVYSGISILSNGVYYVAFLLVWIILPEIDIHNPALNRRLLRSSYKLLGLMAAGSLMVEVIFKGLITRKLLGSAFAGQGSILIFATLFQITLVAVTLYAFYLLVMRSVRSLLLGLNVIALCLVLPWLFGDTPKQMIISLWTAVLLGFGLYFIIDRVKVQK